MDSRTLQLLEDAISRRQPLKSCTNALRLVNGFGDGLAGLIMEQYDRHFVLHISDKRWLKEKDDLCAFVEKRCNGIYLIVKDRTESVSALPDAIKVSVWINCGTSVAVVCENGLKFSVDLNDGLNSGLFLDMRHNRQVVAGRARGKKVLNCFAYTCSFGAYCRAACAISVVNVDISRKSLERGRINYGLNRLTPERNEFIRSDAISYMERAVKKDNRFDLIILDPPSFARYENKTFSVKKNLEPLVKLAFKILNPRGVLFVSTNFSGFSSLDLEGMVSGAAADSKISKIQHLGQDRDFVVKGFSLESYLAAVLVEL